MKLIAFNRGKAISADPIWMGTNRFVKPPKSVNGRATAIDRRRRPRRQTQNRQRRGQRSRRTRCKPNAKLAGDEW